MKTSIQGMMEIASHEGIVQMPYRDSVGIWTWGVGHTAAAGSPNPAQMAKGQATSLKMVFDVFRRDLAKYEAGVNRAFARPLEQHQFDAAVSFHYNTGSIGRATWVKLFNAGDRAGAVEAIMNWAKPPEIKPRRQKEQKLFASGIYTSGGFANVYPADSNGRVQWSKGRRMNLRSIFETDPKPDSKPVIDGPEWGMGEPAEEARPTPPPDAVITRKEPPMERKTGSGSILVLLVIIALAGLFVYGKFFGGWF